MNPKPDNKILEATAVLLTNDHWRQRVVEKVVPVSVDHYELNRSFQFEIPPDLIPDASAPFVDVLLPVCWMQKTALLDFDITDGAGQPTHVMERRSIAGVLSTILDAWRLEIPALSEDDLSIQNLESVCVASLDPWETAIQRGLKKRTHELDWVCAYLNSFFDFTVARDDVQGDLDDSAQLWHRVESLVRTEPSRETRPSTLTNGAILAPYMDPRPTNVKELMSAVQAHQVAVGAICDVAGSDPDARGWLALVAEAGSRWPLLTRAKVPVGRPFLVKTREVRSAGAAGQPKSFVHRADLATARSYHLQVKTPDPTVRITEEPYAKVDEKEYGATNLFENSDLTNAVFATYTSLDPRPEWVDITIKFRLHWQHTIGYWFAIALTLTGLGAALISHMTLTRAVVLTIPTTIVAAFLIARDSPLTSRYLRWWQVALALLNTTLWVVVIVQTVI